MMKGGGSHSLRQWGPPQQWTKDGDAQLNAPDSQKGKLFKLLTVPTSEATSRHAPSDEEFIKQQNLSSTTSRAR
jgi:hypothetical protein